MQSDGSEHNNISKTFSFLKQKKLKGKNSENQNKADAKALETKQIDACSQGLSRK